jgi:hypothetical protein
MPAADHDIQGNALKFPVHGWIGLGLVVLFWILNWMLTGPRTHWGFFPLWLGYCLGVDGLCVRRTGTSLFTRSPRKYAGLFLASAPVWWLFELINLRTRNWVYSGAELFTPLEYALLATLSFSTVVPAVFGAAEFFAGFGFIKRFGRGPVIGIDARTTNIMFLAGWLMLALMLAWPKLFFPFVWISVYFILEPVNVRLGNRSLLQWTARGDWRPIIALWLGVWLTAFFWEMWNYYSYPKWIYRIPWGDRLHVFEMPLPGYCGYLPFALELSAIYNLTSGCLGDRSGDYIQVGTE